MGTVPQGSTTVGALSESVGGQLSESVGVCRSCRRTIVGALSDCRNRAQVGPRRYSFPPLYILYILQNVQNVQNVQRWYVLACLDP